jgi:hypothetical protein
VSVNKENLEKISIKLYPFAYCLCPDELMAGQLVVDAFTRSVLDNDNFDTEHIDFDDLCRSAFIVASSRAGHMKPNKDDHKFYKDLSLKVRSALFLKEKWNLSIGIMAKIMDIEESEVSLLLSEGRGLLFRQRENHI